MHLEPLDNWTPGNIVADSETHVTVSHPEWKAEFVSRGPQEFIGPYVQGAFHCHAIEWNKDCLGCPIDTGMYHAKFKNGVEGGVETRIVVYGRPSSWK